MQNLRQNKHRNNSLLFMIAILLSISTSTFSGSGTAPKSQEVFLDSLVGTHPSEASTVVDSLIWSYEKLIENQLGNLEPFSGMECRLNVEIDGSGYVKYIDMNSQNPLCRSGFNTIWSLKQFPMPADKKAAFALRNFTLILEGKDIKCRVGHWLRHNPYPATPLQFRA